jgi:hypothetical protein
MTTIFDVYNFINFVCDKNRRGFLSPEEVSQALDAGQTDLFHYYWGLPKTSQFLKGDAPTPDYGSSQSTLDALRPFRKKQDLSPTVLSSTSYLDLPTAVPDYAYFLGLFSVGGTAIAGTNIGIQNIEQYLFTELIDALSSSLYPVDFAAPGAPICSFDDTGIQIYPLSYKTYATSNSYYLRLQYISKPTTPVIGYSVSGNTIVPAATTPSGVPNNNIQFGREYWMEVISRALAYIGVNLSSAEVSNLAAQEYTSS